MIIDCPNAQYISQNLVDIASVIIRFKELDAIYSDNLVLYMDGKTWEVFDVRRGITIIRHDFKHVKQLLSDLRLFIRDFANLGAVQFGIGHGRNPKTSEVASIKHLYRVYGMDTHLFSNNYLKKYIYERIEKTENLADCY